jgi:3-dehydroquinate synthase
MKSLDIKIPSIAESRYRITIGANILPSVLSEAGKLLPLHQPFVVTDSKLRSAGYLEKLVQNPKSEIQNFTISPAGENSKNMATVIAILEAMEKALLGRDTVIIALGGGTVGDIAGFAAAIFKRGVPVVQIPTTTVAQADSAIGGKTGVDSSVSKNAFGAFWQPAAVYIDVTTLKTLDERQFRAGLVESVKHALIADAQYFEYLEKNLDAILARDFEALETIAFCNCKIKAAVVQTDPFEKNQRRMLNYGHTLGHAVESASNYQLLHGEAIAIGIIGAALMEERLGFAQFPRLDRIKTIFAKLGVPARIPSYIKRSDVLRLICYDKKAAAKRPRFVLLDEIGTVHTQDGRYALEIQPDIVEKALDTLLRL